VQNRLLRHADFRRLWAADALSQAGTQVTAIALPLLLIKVLDAGPFEVGLLTTFEFLAFLLIGLPAGVWVDRMRRRNVLMVADLVRGLLYGSLPLAWALDALTLAQVYAVALVAGVCTVFFDVAYQSYLPHLVGRDNLVEGNAKLQGTQSVAQVAGPTVGGVLVQALTAPYAILVDAASYLWSAVWVGSIRSRNRGRSGPGPAPRPGDEGGPGLRPGQPAAAGDHRLHGDGQPVHQRRDDRVRRAAGQRERAEPVGRHDRPAVQRDGGRRGARRDGGPAVRGLGRAGTGAVDLDRGRVPAMLPMPFVQRGWLLWLLAAGQVVFGASIVIYNITQVSFRQLLCPERLLGG
jgi:MFS family permease